MIKGGLSVVDFGYDFDKHHNKTSLAAMCSNYNIQASSSSKPDCVFAVESFFAHQRFKHGRHDRSYLEPDFKPRSYSNAQLRQVLAYHDLRVPGKANFETMQAIFEDNLVSMRIELQGYQRAAPEDLGIDMGRLTLHPVSPASSRTLAAVASAAPRRPSTRPVPDRKTLQDATIYIARMFSQMRSLAKNMDNEDYEDVIDGLRQMLSYLPASLAGESSGKSHTAEEGGFQEDSEEYEDTAKLLMLELGSLPQMAQRVLSSDPGHAVELIERFAVSMVWQLGRLA
ncbi:uncharacterized protein RCC_02259 [Ramularia collo-cygni]|uniref:Uncharacterized protein n=1 Tax=Ramularia collo-cygni TaxID=112498 RepID=A0A2D3UYY0_9PEZI|nr:uncharacterized protein RCC_02259 [Ramularia collo-cygni]CZT16416.1 uncharacterized protein RCC_02259 [Ramularia collo-cygni]